MNDSAGSVPVDFESPDDPLFADARLDHRAELPVLGIPVRFASNSPQVMEAVAESFGVWERLWQHPALLADAKARVRFFVHEAMEDPPHAPICYRRPDANRVLVSTRGSFGVAELDRREAYAFVTPQLVGDHAHFRYGVLEALTLCVVTDRNRHPVHAATIVRGGAAVLLVGRSTAGKSTLSYAATRDGLRVMGEDIAYVQLQPEFRVWAMPGRIHLPPDAPRRFPELNGRDATLQANGKRKIAVDVPSAAPEHLPVATRAAVCLLSRDGGPARLERIGSAEVEAALTTGLEPGFDWDPSSAAEVAARLGRRGGWRLHVSGDPEDCVAFLHEMLRDESLAGP